eukprot:SAG31_NODE_18468_length_635_cov_0.966418_2_plen_42_part_01
MKFKGVYVEMEKTFQQFEVPINSGARILLVRALTPTPRCWQT